MEDILLEIKVSKNDSSDLEEIKALKSGHKTLLNQKLDSKIADALTLVREGKAKCSFADCRGPLNRNNFRLAVSYPVNEDSYVFCFHDNCCKGSLQELAKPGEYSLTSEIN